MSHTAMEPDQQEGSYQGCQCSECMEARLRDERHIVYGPPDLLAAYRRGYLDGMDRVMTPPRNDHE
jgi:hypothetical protein